MTISEMSIEFDVLYNNISSNQSPGLTEYEKSVFLTQAQEALVLDLYKGTAGDSFESTEEVTRYLSSLVNKHTFTDIQELNSDHITVSLTAVSDLWFIVYQACIVNGRDTIVVPATHDNLFRNTGNPFRGPSENRVLSVSTKDGIELYTKYPIDSFYIKYLKKPSPIILEDLPEGLTINNQTNQSTKIDLPDVTHRSIVLNAVQLAKSVW